SEMCIRDSLDTVRLVVRDESRRQREVAHAHLSQRWRRTHISIFAGGTPSTSGRPGGRSGDEKPMWQVASAAGGGGATVGALR
ncbi:hypothetical protein, partial [Haloferax sp. ATCC BAA-646]|uniref:hypothetical protein n=1 Tax=Haloferax sp. ATCC BAA-646 TaxID=1227464 RepID=UPI00195526AB